MHFASELGDSRTESTVLSSVCEHIVDCTIFYSRVACVWRRVPGCPGPAQVTERGPRSEERGEEASAQRGPVRSV